MELGGYKSAWFTAGCSTRWSLMVVQHWCILEQSSSLLHQSDSIKWCSFSAEVEAPAVPAEVLVVVSQCSEWKIDLAYLIKGRASFTVIGIPLDYFWDGCTYHDNDCGIVTIIIILHASKTAKRGAVFSPIHLSVCVSVQVCTKTAKLLIEIDVTCVTSIMCCVLMQSRNDFGDMWLWELFHIFWIRKLPISRELLVRLRCNILHVL